MSASPFQLPKPRHAIPPNRVAPSQAAELEHQPKPTSRPNTAQKNNPTRTAPPMPGALPPTPGASEEDSEEEEDEESEEDSEEEEDDDDDEDEEEYERARAKSNAAKRMAAARAARA